MGSAHTTSLTSEFLYPGLSSHTLFQETVQHPQRCLSPSPGHWDIFQANPPSPSGEPSRHTCCFPEQEGGQKTAPAGKSELVFLRNFFRIIDLETKPESSIQRRSLFAWVIPACSISQLQKLSFSRGHTASKQRDSVNTGHLQCARYCIHLLSKLRAAPPCSKH